MKSRLLCIWKFCSILFNYLQGILQLLFILESPRLCTFLYQGNTWLCMIICDSLAFQPCLYFLSTFHASVSSNRNPSGMPSIANKFLLLFVKKSTIGFASPLPSLGVFVLMRFLLYLASMSLNKSST